VKNNLGQLISAYVRLNDTIYVPTRMLSWASRSSILWFLGSHSVDTLRYLANDEVERVYTLSRAEVLKSLGLDVADIYQSILEFRSGLIATMENNWIVPNSNPSVNDFKINLLGSKGMISLDLTHHVLMERFLDQTADHPDFLVGPLIHGRHAGFAYESIRSFVECLALGKPVAASLDDGIRVSKVILAMLESASKREPVRVQY
jgi:predicted dehydrogenase